MRKRDFGHKTDLLNEAQVNALKQNFGIMAGYMRVKDVVPILRKKLKKYKFERTIRYQVAD